MLHASENYLTSLPRFSELGAEAIKPGTERVRDMLELLGNPHDNLTIIHVGGTNGKGSTASMISSVFTAGGFSVGLFTSPHISSVRERFRIDGVPIKSDELDELLNELIPVFEQESPSFFEAVTVAAFTYFSNKKVDLAVVEVGLGGRLDATNVVSPCASVITQIGLDHTDLLGETIAEIAQEKAGIIKAGVPVITGASGVALNVICKNAERLACPVHAAKNELTVTQIKETITGSKFTLKTPSFEYDGLEIPLAGRHQIMNAAIAVRCVEIVSNLLSISETKIRMGLKLLDNLSGLAARIEIVSRDPLVVFDVAHNADGIAAVLGLVSRLYPDKRIAVALAIMQDKNIDRVMSVLQQHNVRLFLVRLELQRAALPEHLEIVSKRYGLTAAVTNSLDEVFNIHESDLSDDILVVLGSHMLIEMARQVLDSR